jgi:hypothetical protein
MKNKTGRKDVEQKRGMNMKNEKSIREFQNNPRLITPKGLKGVLFKPAAGKNLGRTREYFRSLRAAEMAAWEMTGGDYVSSGVFAEAA